MNESEKGNVTANPLIVLREEFDDWAILFDPETGNTFGLNPIGVLIWKQLDGHHSLDDIVTTIRGSATEVPSDVIMHVKTFVKSAVEFGLVQYAKHRG